jgi:cyclopropane fatty-acyl-phospholipid synthase-like methyltransferase
MSNAQDIKRMKLYRHPERIYNELDSAGYKKGMPLKVEDVSAFDQYHYFGTDSIDDAVKILKIDSGKKIIDIGSGIGGPARYLAAKTGCHVTAVELQPDLNSIACSLTESCSLSGYVSHLCADILDFPEKGGNFDALVSWLSFLHIPDRSALLKKCFKILKPDGKIFIEDFCKRGEFSQEEAVILCNDVQCPYLPTPEEYKKQLMENNFTEVELIDKTDCWKDFVRGRLEKFIQNRSRYERIHGIEVTDDLEDFYQKILQLFDNGNLGGLRIIAEK